MNKGLLLGAGFSYDLGMPLAYELTEVFLDMFTEPNAKRLAVTLLKNDPYGQGRPINKEAIFEGINLLLDYKHSKGKNYEELLSNLQTLGDKPGKTQSDRDTYHYLQSVFYEIIHHILSLYQKVSYDLIYSKNRKWFSNLKNLLSNRETWVFTLNHDIYLECLAKDFDIPITYGDNELTSFPISNLDMKNHVLFTYSNRCELKYENNGFFKGEFGINLVKLHGGLSELEYNDRKMLCNQSLSVADSNALIRDFIRIENMGYYHEGQLIPSGRDRVITNLKGELDIIRKSMLTGGKKYSLTTNEKEGEEKLKLFEDALNDIHELTVIGYGFGDKHINYRISNAMVKNENLKLRIVDPVHKSKPEFLEQFDYGLRVRGATCGAPHWIEYSATEKWNKEQMDSLKENEVYRKEIRKTVEATLHP